MPGLLAIFGCVAVEGALTEGGSGCAAALFDRAVRRRSAATAWAATHPKITAPATIWRGPTPPEVSSLGAAVAGAGAPLAARRLPCSKVNAGVIAGAGELGGSYTLLKRDRGLTN